MRKIVSYALAAFVVAASAVLLSGCYVTTGGAPYRHHHPANCKKVERVKSVCVKSVNGHCRRWKTQSRVYWGC
jgi:hypothetical protein